jgi:hypothetical protein
LDRRQTHTEEYETQVIYTLLLSLGVDAKKTEEAVRVPKPSPIGLYPALALEVTPTQERSNPGVVDRQHRCRTIQQ